MPENILEKIIKKKIEKIENSKKNISIGSLNESIEKNKMFINFKENIENLLEVSIGHALITESLYFGLESTIKKYLEFLS